MEKRNSDLERRVRCLQQGKRGRGPVVYWMDRDQRVDDNWALLLAQQEALLLQCPLVVVYALPEHPPAGRRQLSFMLRGLAELRERLREHNIHFRLLEGEPAATLPACIDELDASLLLTDFNPLRVKQQWIGRISRRLSVPLYEVDAHNIVPAWVVSEKKEYGAYTLRPKINRLLDDYLTPFPRLVRHPFGNGMDNDPGDGKRLGDKLADVWTPQVAGFEPGEKKALAAASSFIAHRLDDYARLRNDPCAAGQSGLSPYLHFGMLAPQRAALEVRSSGGDDQAVAAFLEELIVRRELADNFCLHEPFYDSTAGFPAWAQKNLQEHQGDRRSHVYTLEELEQAGTHERLWNACQRDLVENGKLHGYLRMYWAKKILEWTRSPEEAMAHAITLNDRYSLDGNDPNGYAGIAWSIGGVHDRAWARRPVFGKIRYMNERGCRRKFDVEEYIQGVESKGQRNAP